jgi:hypothetical protein
MKPKNEVREENKNVTALGRREITAARLCRAIYENRGTNLQTICFLTYDSVALGGVEGGDSAGDAVGDNPDVAMMNFAVVY